MNDHVVIVGAGPAGLTAALELQRSGFKNGTVIEASNQVGGISRTHNHGGNRIDIGGHRFFSKSDWVMNWWTNLMPVAFSSDQESNQVFLQYQGQQRHGIPSSAHAVPSESDDNVMLVRNRLSRIYFNRQFFDYPLKLNLSSVVKLGPVKTIKFGLSYMIARVNPRRPEKSLEDFLINRFGNLLYRQFFKEYTEKVWGVPCAEISAEWGAQRIKSLSVMKALAHAVRSAIGLGDGKAQQTSLIESFIYPKHGPGQMWEIAARRFEEQGGNLLFDHRVEGIRIEDGRAVAVTMKGRAGEVGQLKCSHVVSTMPIKDLVSGISGALSDRAREVASGLQYRDFFTVGLLYRKSDLRTELNDNWIYIQEPGVNVGRVQVFNNWSPYMVRDPDTVWLGLEFFCVESDDIWTRSDEELVALAQKEMQEIALVSSGSSLDAVVLRVPKAYPGYFGQAYSEFDLLREELDRVDNLYLIGRNGMHRYNNQDHSMLTAKEAVEQIVSGRSDKARIWAVNVGDDYHEEKASA